MSVACGHCLTCDPETGCPPPPVCRPPDRPERAKLVVSPARGIGQRLRFKWRGGRILLADLGDPARGLPPCEACHGLSLEGPVETPLLLGQSTPYLEQQLQLFASRQRDNDLFVRMRTIAAELTPAEMRGLAVYYGGNPAPR